MKKLAFVTLFGWMLCSCSVGDLSLDPPGAMTSPQAIMLYQKAASGNTNALLEAEKCFTYGSDGFPRDKGRALECVKMLAERGSVEHQRRLGMAYLHGLGVSQSESQAQVWLTKAAAQGDEIARRAVEAHNYSAAQAESRERAQFHYRDVMTRDSVRQLTADAIYVD